MAKVRSPGTPPSDLSGETEEEVKVKEEAKARAKTKAKDKERKDRKESTKWRIRAVNRKATARSGTRTRAYGMKTVAQEGPSGMKASGTRMTRTVLPGRHRTSGRVPLHRRSKQRRILEEASRCWEVWIFVQSKSGDRNTMKTINERTEESNRKITFGVDTAACRTVVPGNHPAARGYRGHWDSGAGVPYSTAGKSMVWDEGRRLLVAKQATGEPIMIESRQGTVRRPLMAVKPMTAQGQWVFFGPDRAFAYKIETGRVIPFEPTPTGWNLTMELEAPGKRQQEASGGNGHEDCRNEDSIAEPVEQFAYPSERSAPIHPFGRQGTSL